jgi:hypothetical protein
MEFQNVYVLQFVISFTIYYIKCVCPRIWVSRVYVQELRGCLHLEAKGWSPKKCCNVIGGNKWYPTFGYTPKNKWAWALVFFSG